MRKVLISAAAAALLTLSVATPAMADELPSSGTVAVDYKAVCRDKGATDAQMDQFDPRAGYCVTSTVNGSLGFPSGVSVGGSSTIAGGLDIQAWCSRNYPGSNATVRWNPGYWYFQQQLYPRAYQWVCQG